MISTITVSTITTISSLSAQGLIGLLGGAAVVMLILFLVVKELAGASTSDISLRISSFTNVPIIPLLLVFAAIVAVKVVEILS